jgi:Ser/Thr protein kinase RdoA (MazF antagonist)
VPTAPPLTALAAWPDLASLPARPLDGGLINTTFAVGDPPVAVLQKQHPMFPPRVNEDIEAVTAHVAAAGMLTPRPIRTGDGALHHVDDDGACWRALSWVPGHTVDRLDGPGLAASAGALVARWHRITADLEHTFRFVRPGAHDTPAHLAALARAVDELPEHRLRDRVAPLAEELAGAWSRWQGSMELATRVVHGDLKISNLRFDEAGLGLCLLDFDTLSRQPLEVELADAARSWCNPRGEDVTEATFDAALFEAAFGAYHRVHPLDAERRTALVATIERICTELAARFAADALRESYFGWNPAIAPTRGDHNLLRALGQASLARSVRAQRAALERDLGPT